MNDILSTLVDEIPKPPYRHSIRKILSKQADCCGHVHKKNLILSNMMKKGQLTSIPQEKEIRWPLILLCGRNSIGTECRSTKPEVVGSYPTARASLEIASLVATNYQRGIIP